MYLKFSIKINNHNRNTTRITPKFIIIKTRTLTCIVLSTRRTMILNEHSQRMESHSFQNNKNRKHARLYYSTKIETQDRHIVKKLLISHVLYGRKPQLGRHFVNSTRPFLRLHRWPDPPPLPPPQPSTNHNHVIRGTRGKSKRSLLK